MTVPTHRHPHVSRLVLLVALVAGVALAGCGQTPNDTRSATAGLPDLEQSLMAHQWLLDPADSTIATTGDEPVTLVFTSGTAASGTAPCNTYRTQVTLDGDTGVRFAPPVTTLVACEPALMDAEAAYLTALAEVRTADVTDRSRLVLTADGVRLSFSAFDIGSALVGDWTIVNLRTPQAIEGVLDGTQPTASFGEDRILVVSTGCNPLRTRWSHDGATITIDPPARTEMACDQPAGVMDQEAALADALVAATTIEVTPATLTLLDDTGSIVLVATRP